LPVHYPTKPAPSVTPSKTTSAKRKPRHLSLLSGGGDPGSHLTRGEVADRLGVSISTVRRYEGTQLHPTVDEHGVRWFTQVEVTAFAAKLANERGDKPSHMAGVTSGAPKRTAGELAALAFERFEQRQSLAEIVIGLRIESSVVRALFDEWCLGLTAGHLRTAREPVVARGSRSCSRSYRTIR
jgi:hypothetical protein